MTIDAKYWKLFHLCWTVVWFIAIIPTVLWWKTSILWVALISCYANAASHFSAWQGTRAEEEARDNGKD
jgi:hypothetical protein